MKISDFNITGQPIPEDVADKILKFHLRPLEIVNLENPNLNVRVSKKSGYRPRIYELSKGRSGNSHHCFYVKGAVDVTCDDFASNKDKFINEIIRLTDYTRIAVYNTFVHLDYGFQDERWLFNSKWQRVKRISW